MTERDGWVCAACVGVCMYVCMYVCVYRCLHWACCRASCVVCVVTTTMTPVMIWQHSTVRSPPAPVCSSWTISCLQATVTPATTRHSSACDMKVISLSHFVVRPTLPAWSSTLSTSFVRWQMSRLVSDFVPVHLRHWLSAAPDCLLSVTELFRLPLRVWNSLPDLVNSTPSGSKPPV